MESSLPLYHLEHNQDKENILIKNNLSPTITRYECIRKKTNKPSTHKSSLPTPLKSKEKKWSAKNKDIKVID